MTKITIKYKKTDKKYNVGTRLCKKLFSVPWFIKQIRIDVDKERHTRIACQYHVMLARIINSLDQENKQKVNDLNK